MATSLTLENDSSLAQGYLKVNGSTAATLTTSGITANLTGNVSGTATDAASGSQLALKSAKAWVNFNGTTSPGTIRSSYNVSSVTRTGTGEFLVNFTTPMTDANYSATTTTVWTGGPYIASVNSQSIDFVKIVTGLTTGVGVNLDRISVQVFGN